MTQADERIVFIGRWAKARSCEPPHAFATCIHDVGQPPRQSRICTHPCCTSILHFDLNCCEEQFDPAPSDAPPDQHHPGASVL